MQPAEKRPETIYRRRSDLNAAAAKRSMLRGFAPALAPLVVGFLLLLALISWLSVRNVGQMDEVAVEARELTRRHSARLELLLDLRLAVTRLDNEARTRHNEES